MRILTDKDALSFGMALIVATILAVYFEKAYCKFDVLLDTLTAEVLK
jgi:hypothetical protein